MPGQRREVCRAGPDSRGALELAQPCGSAVKVKTHPYAQTEAKGDEREKERGWGIRIHVSTAAVHMQNVHINNMFYMYDIVLCSHFC